MAHLGGRHTSCLVVFLLGCKDGASNRVFSFFAEPPARGRRSLPYASRTPHDVYAAAGNARVQ